MAKPWPNDAVMIVAPSPEEAVIDPQEETAVDSCRDCGARVLYRLRSVKATAPFPGRPVRFFCIPCAVTYDRGTVTHLVDLRPTV
jgi:DNA-directed RNA polymerase subunit RPC12/RpoP